MTNAIYPKGKERLLKGDFDLDVDTIRVVLVDLADYTYSAAHTALSDIAAGGRVATVTLASITSVDGLFDAADATFSAVTGDVSEALVIYKDSGVASTSWLLVFFDTDVTGLPVTPNGGNINIVWNAGGIVQF